MVYKVDSDEHADFLRGVVRAGCEIRSIEGHGPSISKRGLDMLLAGMAVLFFAPFFLLIACVILLTDGRPVFFGHRRVGREGREFACLKFRTMCKNADQRLADHLAGNESARREWTKRRKLSSDPRITRVGAFLRKSSLDELPQLFNILRGDMSVVGPRPVVEDEARYYGSDFATYKSVRPGWTGLWQVSGRSDTGYDARVALDVHYVENQSLLMDLRVIARTAVVVVMGKGAE